MSVSVLLLLLLFEGQQNKTFYHIASRYYSTGPLLPLTMYYYFIHTHTESSGQSQIKYRKRWSNGRFIVNASE